MVPSAYFASATATTSPTIRTRTETTRKPSALTKLAINATTAATATTAAITRRAPVLVSATQPAPHEGDSNSTNSATTRSGSATTRATVATTTTMAKTIATIAASRRKAGSSVRSAHPPYAIRSSARPQNRCDSAAG